MKIGDRVIWDPSKRCIDHPKVVAHILDISIYTYWDYYIVFDNVNESKLHVLRKEIELDHQWYRDIKLNKLLNKTL